MAVDDENFANAPMSIAEARAFRDNRSDKLTPRDALIYLLRAIDRGETTIDVLVICMGQRSQYDEHITCESWVGAGKRSAWETIGLIDATKHLILSQPKVLDVPPKDR